MTEENYCELALKVRSAYKSYASQVVLRGLDMTLPKGIIYGLLGPSGCGKTTLFKCIVGNQNLDSGEIVVAAKQKPNIGYMPQEIALYQDFKIKETLIYYGTLYGMSKEEINKRVLELVELLRLPPLDQTIRYLSGGQQRRVSFSIALLHNPQFLILDEPTVGLDPVICHDIWQYLLHLTVNERKSVLITTHYIEEARQASLIGFMRNGVLLVEQSPQSLIDTHGCTNLEQVFFQISESQSNSNSSKEIQVSQNSKVPKTSVMPPLEESKHIEYFRINAQNKKNLCWLWRNIIFTLIVFNLTIVANILVNACVGNRPKELHMGYVNDEVSNGVANCSFTQLHGCHLQSPLSCRLINTLENNGLILTEFNEVDEGLDAVKNLNIWGLMHFSTNYSSSYLTRLQSGVDTSDEDTDLSSVNIWMDMSDQVIGTMVRHDVYFGFIKFQKKLFYDCGWPLKAAQPPIVIEEAIYGSNSYDLSKYASPAMVTIAQFFMPALFTVAALMDEKSEGLLERNMVAGLTICEVLIAHGVVQLVLLLIHTVLIMFVNFVVYDNVMVGDWTLYMSFLVSIGICGALYGLFICTLSKTFYEATVLGIGIFLAMVFLTGLVWPIEGMHYLLRTLSSMTPLTKPAEAYRAIASRGWPMSHPTILLGFFTLFVWIVLFSIGAFILIKWFNGTKSTN